MIDRDQGLAYCGDDEAFYQSILEDFAADSHIKLRELDRAKREGLWTEYRRIVHSLISIAKTIGAEALSEHARTHQNAADAGDKAFIFEDYGAFISEWQAVISEIGPGSDSIGPQP